MKLIAWLGGSGRLLALPLAAFAVLVVAVINESGYDRSAAALTSLAERGNARVELQQLLRLLVDAETGQRGYLLTGRAEYLEPYQRAIAAADGSIEKLQGYYGSDVLTRDAMTRLAELSQNKLSEMATSLTLYDAGKHEQWRTLLLTNLGKEAMDDIRGAATGLIATESERIGVQRQGIFDTLAMSRFGVHLMAAVTLLALFAFLRKTRDFEEVQAAHAVALKAERDLLEAEVTRRTEDLSELASHLQSAREDERARLARELHDELGALLTAAKLDAARLKRGLGPAAEPALERLASLSKTLDEVIALKRRIIEDLRPSSLANLGLVAAIEILCREFGQRAELAVHVHAEPVALDEGAEITAYRLVQESLTNVARYAKATEVHVELHPDGTQVRVAVRDNGVGFSPGSVRRNAHGLVGMRHRVSAAGGEMRVISRPGQGTSIEACLPQRREVADAEVG